MTNKITIIQKEVSPIVKKAKALVISTPKELTKAVSILSELNIANDKITEEKEKVTKPLNEALKAERSRWKPMEIILETAITAIRQKMSSYQTEIAKKQKEEEAKVAEQLAKGEISFDEATKAIVLPDNEGIETKAGTVKFRTVQVLKVVDISLIPDEYWEIMESKLLADLKAGKTIAGVELEEQQVPINYR